MNDSPAKSSSHKKSQLQKELCLELCQAQNYRDFLTNAFELFSKYNKNFSYSYFAKKAGFASRSYPREVLIGRKRITNKSLPKFLKALELDKDSEDYFKLLIFEEEADTNIQKLSKSEIQREKDKCLQRLMQRDFKLQNEASQILYELEDWPKIYASLGDKEGATVNEISKRSGLPKLIIRQALQILLKKGLVKYFEQTDRYASDQVHIIFPHLNDNDFFKRYFIRSIEKAKELAEVTFGDDKSFFFNSTVSIKKDKFPEFASELHRIMHKYVDEIEDAKGDKVAQVSVAMYLDS